jgi:hypothetical protein
MTRPMQALAIMQEFGWSWDEYQATPTHILALIPEKLKRDRKREELAANRRHRG